MNKDVTEELFEEESEVILEDDSKMEEYFSGDSYKEFLKEMGRYPRLSDIEITYLFQRYQEGDEASFDKLFYSNLRLVVHCAKIYKNSIKNLQIMDIIQEGAIALMNAIKRYKIEEGKFSTYAARAIRRTMLRTIDNQEDTVRKSVYYETINRKYRMIIAECTSSGKEIPSDEELCKMLNITPLYLATIKQSINFDTVSMNKTISDKDNSELMDLIGEENSEYETIENDFDTKRLLVVLKSYLKPIEYYIIYHHIIYKDEITFEKISEIFHISKERIRQIEESTLQKVRPLLKDNSVKFKKIIDDYALQKISLNRVQTNPIDPNDLFKFLYIKSDLDEKERKLLYLKLFGELKYTQELGMKELNCTKEELKEIESLLSHKIAQKFSNINQYIQFTKNIASYYGIRIYDLVLESKEYDFIDDEELKRIINDSNVDFRNREFLANFLAKKEHKEATNVEIEKDVYLSIFGFKNIFSVPKSKLYKTYLMHNKEFNEEERLFLDTYIFSKKNKKKFDEKYPSSTLYTNHKYLILKLEMLFYNINDLFESPFNKEMYLEVKEKYPEYLSKRKEMILDLYFGTNLRALTISEIAIELNEDYTKLKREIYETIRVLKNLYHNNSKTLIIDKEIYRKYLLDKKYEFTEETRNVLKLFLIDDLSYEEIAKKLNLERSRVTNIINDGLRRIDYYRFGIIDIDIIDEEILSELFVLYKDKLSQLERKIIFDKKCLYLSNEDICKKYNITSSTLTKIMMKFNKLYSEFRIKDVVIYECDVYNEIERETYDSVLTNEEKLILALFYGYKCNSNLGGLKLSKSKIASMLNKDKSTIADKINKALIKIKKRKINLIKPELLYVDRNIIKSALEDIHLPLDDDKKEIICKLLGLNGYVSYEIEELASMYNTTSNNIKRQYQRGIVRILKYLNKEIEGNINYQEEILPNLRFFSKRDRDFIIDKYENKLTNEQIASKYQVTIDYINRKMNELNHILDSLIKGNLIRFDFDLYRSLVNDPLLPFSGDFSLTKQCFELYTGEVTYENLSIKDVMERLNITCSEETVRRYIKLFMLSIYRLQNGVKTNYSFSNVEIQSYYLTHQSEMNLHRRSCYERCIAGFGSELFSNKDNLSDTILYDLLKARDPHIFDLNTICREEVLGLLYKYYDVLNIQTRNSLMKMFQIDCKEFMSKKELGRILKIVEKNQ